MGVETGTFHGRNCHYRLLIPVLRSAFGTIASALSSAAASAREKKPTTALKYHNNVSIEYKINPGATRYARIFYERGTTDPLEGLLTKTGIGYAVRKKTDRFGDLFIFWRKKSKDQTADIERKKQ